MALERGIYSLVTASINSATTTAIATPGTGQSIYVLYASIDVTTGVASALAQIADGSTPIMTANAASAGHTEATYATGDPNYPGYKLSQDGVLNLITSSTAALRATVIIKIR